MSSWIRVAMSGADDFVVILGAGGGGGADRGWLGFFAFDLPFPLAEARPLCRGSSPAGPPGTNAGASALNPAMSSAPALWGSTS